MAVLKFTHPHYNGKVTMIQEGSELNFYNNNVLVEKHVCNSEAEARTRFDNNVRFYTGHAL